MKPFHLPSCPLKGTHLIEADAGTGKTYAIVGLYVRLILERALHVREILVVTFTLAATAELKGRIRSKLREALEALTRQESRDDLLQALLAALSDPARKEACERLREALREFDEAAIFTIHGFCQRMLHEHPFESGVPFDTELVTDQRPLQREIIEDFWRIRFYEAPSVLVEYALGQGFSPAALMSWTTDMPLNPDIRILPDSPLSSLEAIHALSGAFHSAVDQLQALWISHREEVRLGLRDPSLKANIYSAQKADRLVEAMDAWLRTREPQLFDDFEKLTPESLVKASRKNTVPPEHPVFDACGPVLEKATALCRELDRYLISMKTDLVRTLRQELPARRRKQGILFYDDLLLRLRHALKNEGGDLLATSIRDQFQAALIDEFQDTDPVQYDIFHTLFGRPDQSLFVIGDPKQAIYSFRGADIFAYMKAAKEIGNAHTLDQNRRSDPGLIQAVNTLFTRTGKPFVYDEIVFRPARPAPSDSRDILTIRGERTHPFEWWFIPAGQQNAKAPPLSKQSAEIHIARALAAEISNLLRLGRDRQALIGLKPLQEADMAVLVRTNREARMIQQALQNLRIASVMAGEENVFDSREARELYQVLQGIACPAREDLVRGALSTDMLCGSAAALNHWLEDDFAWSVRLETVRQDHDLWETRGFMSMFRMLMARDDIRGRLLRFPDGERRLTNVLHLVDILHEESTSRRLDIRQLLQWLARQINGEARETREDYVLRLESDANAVKVLTIHKSKGLEYPIVFCPYAWGNSRIDGKKTFLFHDAARKRELTFDIGSANSAEHRFEAERERLAENCRLLYVALTRARHRCYFVWGRINQTGSSAPAYLFHENRTKPDDREHNLVDHLERKIAPLSDRDMLEDLQRIAADSGGTIHLRELPAGPGVLLDAGSEDAHALTCRRFKGSIDSSWKVASYSLLISAPGDFLELPDRDALAPDADAAENHSRPSIPARRDGLPDRQKERTIFHLPGGTRTGILLHDILEHFDFTERSMDEISRLVAQKLLSHGFDTEWESVLSGMLRDVTACTLTAPQGVEEHSIEPLKLSLIPKSARLNELEFYFPLKKLTCEKMSDLFRTAEQKQTSLERLNFDPVHGFMRGIIDLVFEHAGRFYVVDWKSNILGSGIEDYAKARLQKAMEENFYILQSRLYALALHRYLMLRLPDYRYEKHFGGVYYLFVRGMKPEHGPAYGVYADLPDANWIEQFVRMLTSGT
jgi:exodeoxyribonuclease V beta subunit